MDNRKGRIIAIWIWTLVPVLTQLWIVTEYRTDLIIRDEFRHILPRVQHLLEGEFSFAADLWANQNVHRPVLPLLFIMANAYFASWNVLYETLAGFAGYVALLIVLTRAQLRTFRTIGLDALSWSIPVVSFLLFSMTSWKIFYMGYAALQHSFSILGVVFGLFVLGRSERPLRALSGAALLGIVGTLSFAPALVFWPAGCFVLACKRTETLRDRTLHLALWVAVSIVVVSIYMIDMAPRDLHFSFLPRLLEKLEFTLAFVGAPICNYNLNGAVIAGLGGLLALPALALYLVFFKRVSVSVVAPYVSLGLFSFGAGFLTSMGRLYLQVEVVLQRDWKIFASPLWIALAVLTCLALQLLAQTRRVGPIASDGNSGPGEEGANSHASGIQVATPLSVRSRTMLDGCMAIALPTAMAIVMLSFWLTNFTEIDLYERRHIPLARLSARIQDKPLPSVLRIPSFRQDLSKATKRSARIAAQRFAELQGMPVTYKELRALHSDVDREGSAWRMNFLRRHRLAIYRD